MAPPISSDQRLATTVLKIASLVMRPRPRGTNRSYRRFVVLGHQRSGSTLIVATLLQHPNVVCFSEAFNPVEAQMRVPGLPATSTALARLRESAPRTFLDRLVYCGYPDAIHAVGFKAMADHLEQRDSGPALRDVFTDPDVGIVRITRRNKLAAALSLHNARRTGEWARPASSIEPSSPVAVLDPSFCEETMATFEEQDAVFDALLADRDKLRLDYEDLIEHPRDHLHAVQEYLGLVPLALPETLQKQQIRSLPDAIANFDELAAVFAGTRFEGFFTAAG